jgi:hypothetical protein
MLSICPRQYTNSRHTISSTIILYKKKNRRMTTPYHNRLRQIGHNVRHDERNMQYIKEMPDTIPSQR